MDKYEYKIRSEEIRNLIASGNYADAAALADTIDWRRVKSVMMLCTISDLYKINRRYEDAKEMLLLAYDRHPGGRSVVYSLCELSIKMEEFVQAVEYYKEFVQIAPKDSGRYVLQYKLYEAQEVSLEERIEVLEELKSKDYSEKWAYELAYLYHRIGLGTKCVEECDELILWFGEGRYVQKAMELKQLHTSLNEEQQEKYDMMKAGRQPVKQDEPDIANAPTKRIPQKEVENELDIQVKMVNVGQYDTINIQKELAENMRELMEEPLPEEYVPEEAVSEGFLPDAEEIFSEEDMQEEFVEEEAAPEEFFSGEDMPEEPVGEEAAQEEFFSGEDMPEEPVEEETAPEEFFSGEDMPEELIEEEAAQEEFFSGEDMPEEPVEETGAEEPVEKESAPEEAESGKSAQTKPSDETASTVLAQMKKEAQEGSREEQLTSVPAGDMREWQLSKNPAFEKILGMDYDGQMRMVVPDAEKVEKQITGQISLADVLVEWEKMKKESEQKRMEALRQHVQKQTDAMFTEFDATKDGLLEQLESSSVEEDVPVGDEEEFDEFEEIEEINEETEGSGTEDKFEEPKEEGSLEEEFEELEDSEAEEAEADAGPDAEEPAEEVTEEAFEEPEDSEAEELAGDPEEEAEADAEPEAEEPSEELAEEAEADAGPEAEEPSEEVTEEAEADAEPEAEEPTEEVTEEAEADKEPGTKEPAQENKKGRALSAEERQLFGAYIQSRETKDQIVHALDNISMAAYTGNVIITGDEGMDTMSLAKNLVREIQQTDSNFSGQVAKISGESLNRRNVADILQKIANGALIVQKAGKLTDETAGKLLGALEQENTGIVVILEDSKTAMHRLLKNNGKLKECFNIEINVEALDDDALVAFAKKYAREQEYSIDEMGILALHTRIAEMQTSDHAVTIAEVREILDEAICHANKKTLGHFFDILVAKRYDEEDMIVLREHDFI